MYFYFLKVIIITYYYYHTKLTFFSSCAHKKSRVNWSQKIDHFCFASWPSCLYWISNISHFNKLFQKASQTNWSVVIFLYRDRIIAEFANSEGINKSWYIFLRYQNVFFFWKNISCGTKSLCESASDSPLQESLSAVTKSRSSS